MNTLNFWLKALVLKGLSDFTKSTVCTRALLSGSKRVLSSIERTCSLHRSTSALSVTSTLIETDSCVFKPAIHNISGLELLLWIDFYLQLSQQNSAGLIYSEYFDNCESKFVSSNIPTNAKTPRNPANP